MAQFISRVFNPLLNPVIAFALLIFMAPKMGAGAQIFYFTIAAIFSSLVIFGYIYYLKHKRVIQSTELIVREHRINPLTFAVLSYATGFFFLTLFNAPAIVRGLMFCYVTNTIVVLMITRRWKISIHTTAMANPLVAIVYQFGWMLLPILGLVPLVGLSRVKMGRHDLLQVTAGGLLGVLMTALQLSFF
jgi:membrane-associated phospholipid phosphatase